MLFNSIDFAVFLPIVFLLYWFVLPRRTWQNALLLVASYVFYGWWDWKFLILIFLSTVLDYGVGVALSRTEDNVRRKLLLGVSLLFNLGSLGFFKYYNFFSENFARAFSFLGLAFSPAVLNIVLPVGISFYTFQTLSYSIDVYNRELEPTESFVEFAAFVSFFPQLVAGPIERASNLLPQFQKDRTFDRERAVDGLRQILWGLFKKIVIADNCAEYVNSVYGNYTNQPGSALAIAAILFAFQIYGDFSGYSDIAIGTSRLFGFGLMRNFANPYFSRSIPEFWRRWHISLSTWFRDYVYIPLGGSRRGLARTAVNTLILFLVSGFWHGANWTFIAWGALNAFYMVPSLMGRRVPVKRNEAVVATLRDLPAILRTFLLTVLGWILFRSDHLSDAFAYIGRIFSPSLFTMPLLPERTIYTLGLILLLVVIEWRGRTKAHPLEGAGFHWPWPARWSLYYSLVLVIYFFSGRSQQFIYFQF